MECGSCLRLQRVLSRCLGSWSRYVFREVHPRHIAITGGSMPWFIMRMHVARCPSAPIPASRRDGTNFLATRPYRQARTEILIPPTLAADEIDRC